MTAPDDSPEETAAAPERVRSPVRPVHGLLAVVAAALVVKPYCRKIPGVRDSKTLSLQQRERLYGQILSKAVAVGVGAASALWEMQPVLVSSPARISGRMEMRVAWSVGMKI